MTTNLKFSNNTGVYNGYDSGTLEAVSGEVVVTPAQTVVQVLLFPTEDASVKLNDSEKWIFLPAGMWTPISIPTETFTVKVLAGSGDIHWQGWFL